MESTKPSFVLSLSENAKRALAKGTIVGSLSLLIYLFIVAATTPSLPSSVAIRIALTVNSIVIVGSSMGIGLQVFLSSYSRLKGCRLDKRKRIVGAGSSGTAFSSFLSFFSLVPLGCCGTWLYIISFLPSIVGGTLSASLIQFSKQLSYLALTVIWGFSAFSAFKLKRELAEREKKVSRV